MHRLQERAKHFWGQDTDFATQEEKKIYEEGLEAYNRYKDRKWDEHTASVPDIDLYKLSGLRDLVYSLQKRRLLNKRWNLPESK